MTHPRERRTLSRRQLLRGAAGAAASVGVAGALAGCADTTTPVGSSAGAATGAAAKLVVPKPLGPEGLPLPRPDNAVTWAITAGNPMIAAGKKPEGGTLKLYNYADYIYPGLLKKFAKQFNCQVSVATYNSSDEAYAKLVSGSVSFDVVIGLSANLMTNFIAKQILQPLNHEYLPNLAKNVWPALQDPFYDRGARYTVPYVVWSDGIGWRNDKIKVDIASMKVPWDIFWQSAPYAGKVGILDDVRDALAIPMQRDAMHKGAVADLNTEDAAIIDKAGTDLTQASHLCNAKITITDYQTLPEGKTWLHHSWSGDLISAAIYYMPTGVKPSVLSYWAPDKGGVVQNDMLIIPRNATKPVLAHQFLNFMLDEGNAYDNFVKQNGYVPPQNGIDAQTLIKRGVIPKTLEPALVQPDQFANNQELLALTPAGERHWENAWVKFKAG
jgi:spermidine/putrescine transport system substrate-binding protein